MANKPTGYGRPQDVYMRPELLPIPQPHSVVIYSFSREVYGIKDDDYGLLFLTYSKAHMSFPSYSLYVYDKYGELQGENFFTSNSSLFENCVVCFLEYIILQKIKGNRTRT